MRPITNRLLDALPAVDRQRITDACETVELAYGDQLYTPGEPLRSVYFPTSCAITLIMPIDSKAALEVGLVGREGMFGSHMVLGVNEVPLRATVQGTGIALRMDAASFQRELERHGEVYRLISRYLFVQVSQLAQTSGCTRFHLIEARLARWLLMSEDRACSAALHLTQDHLALMLGVRRVSITRAAMSLQERGLIQYVRGNMIIVDRPGLRAASCGCYPADLSTYERLIG